MAEVVYSRRFAAALENVFEFIAQADPGHAAQHIDLIVDGLLVLERHPRIGRPAARTLRELVMGTGSRCYVVLYQYDIAADRVVILTIRHSSQAGYRS